MNRIKKFIITSTLSIFALLTVRGQESAVAVEYNNDTITPKKAWEIGIGGTGYQMTRFGLIDFYKNSKEGYSLETVKKDVIFGGQLYIARELSKHFALDLQGDFAYASDPIKNGNIDRWLAMASLGLQWRLGEYFGSKYIDPFLRLGAGYMYKNFTINYVGNENLNNDRIDWALQNEYNKSGDDRQHLIPVVGGAGVNMWLNDRLGIGLQADYLYMPYKNVANSFQGSARLMWRIGGESKKPAPEIQYKEVERIVEVPKEVIVEKPVKEEVSLCELFNNIYFDFDKAQILPSSNETLDIIADVMKKNNHNYLILGYTDARGSQSYNQSLSERRAKAVVEALISRGVSDQLLKYKGVGKRASLLSAGQTDEARRGDRKVVVEIIQNESYWNAL